MLSAREVAELTGWPIRTVRYKAQTGRLPAETVVNARNRKEYLFPLAGLPTMAQEKHYTQQSRGGLMAESLAAQTAKAEPVQRPLDSYTDAQREEIGFWRDILEQWMLYRSQPGKPLGELDQKFVRHMSSAQLAFSIC